MKRFRNGSSLGLLSWAGQFLQRGISGSPGFQLAGESEKGCPSFSPFSLTSVSASRFLPGGRRPTWLLGVGPPTAPHSDTRPALSAVDPVPFPGHWPRGPERFVFALSLSSFPSCGSERASSPCADFHHIAHCLRGSPAPFALWVSL